MPVYYVKAISTCTLVVNKFLLNYQLFLKMIQSYSCMFIDHLCQTFEDKEKTSFTHSTHTSCLNFSKVCLSNVSSQRVITETNSTWKGNLSQSYEWIYHLEQNTSINSIDLGAPVVNLLYFKSRKITTDLETRVLLLLQKLAASDNIQNSKGEGVFTYGYRSSCYKEVSSPTNSLPLCTCFKNKKCMVLVVSWVVLWWRDSLVAK